MTKKTWWLLGGVIVIVITLIIVFLTGPGAPVQKAGAGAGYSPGPGQGLGIIGTGSVTPSLLPQNDARPLTPRETDWILFMREEEQLAHDAYLRWAGKYPVPVFSNIASSETTHVTEVQLLIDRYGLGDYRIGNASTGFTDPLIQSRFTTLSAQGDTSQAAALEAGLAIEERDIADLDLALANTTRSDIIQVYTNLLRGSENHRSAFLRQLGR